MHGRRHDDRRIGIVGAELGMTDVRQSARLTGGAQDLGSERRQLGRQGRGNPGRQRDDALFDECAVGRLGRGSLGLPIDVLADSMMDRVADHRFQVHQLRHDLRIDPPDSPLADQLDVGQRRHGRIAIIHGHIIDAPTDGGNGMGRFQWAVETRWLIVKRPPSAGECRRRGVS